MPTWIGFACGRSRPICGQPDMELGTSCIDSERELADDCRIRLVHATSFAPDRVQWAAEARIPLGMVTLVVGQAGTGKSTNTARYLAGWTVGTVPGDLYGEPVNVAVASAEDHRSAVVIPRLLAAGADLERVRFVEEIRGGAPGDLQLNGQVADLERALEAGACRVLVIDTVIAHVPGRWDTYKEQDVRAILKPLAHMAEKLNLAVVGVMHLNRRESTDVLSRIAGSGGFGQLARSILLVAADPDDPDCRVEIVAKSNLAAKPSPIRLKVESASVRNEVTDEAIATSRMVEVGPSKVTAEQILASTRVHDDGALADAKEVLLQILADGPIPADLALSEAAKAGVSEATIRRARRSLGVETRKGSFDGGWMWFPPQRDGAPTKASERVCVLNSASPKASEGDRYSDADALGDVDVFEARTIASLGADDGTGPHFLRGVARQQHGGEWRP